MLRVKKALIVNDHGSDCIYDVVGMKGTVREIALALEDALDWVVIDGQRIEIELESCADADD